MQVVDLLFYDVKELALRTGFVFVRGVGRYRNLASGQFVAEKSLQSVVESYADSYVRPALESTTEKFLRGEISLTSWQEQIARELKDAYVTVSAIGRGGRGSMGFSDWGRVGGHLRFEYRHLNTFAQEIKNGMLSAGQIRFRVGLYADGVKVVYWEGRRAAMVDAGYTQSRRVLHPAEHCEDCVGYASQGWVPIGTQPPPGLGSRCLHECKCTEEFRTTEEVV